MSTQALSLAVCGLCFAVSTVVSAQTAPPIVPSASSEEIEPRVVATRGTTMIGISGSLDHFQSREQRFPLNFNAYVDVTRFVTSHVAVVGGVTGSGSLGGDDSEERPRGLGAPALHVFGGALYYFTPQSIMTLYAGPSYWNQLSERSASDTGAVVGLLGAQAAMSSRAMVFLEGGYGAELSRGSREEIRTRLLGRIGIRVRF